MSEPKAFLTYGREEIAYRPVEERVTDFREFDLPLAPESIHRQAARCMSCGIPFCHGAGCPLNNSIPDLNELVYLGRWREACDYLHATNNFPEFTARVCPALCESACTLGINDDPVLIKHIEYQIVERGFSEGWIQPQPPQRKTGKRVSVVGSGPAGLAAAQQLARAGHNVVLFEKDKHPGGLLRYGIPDFKLGKHIIDRRLEQMTAEGVKFQTEVDVGTDISARYLQKMFDCTCLAMGAGKPRDLSVQGRGYENVVFAMDFLSSQNKVYSGEIESCVISAKGKNVVVIGGGDTGSDCVGTARRQGATQIHQLELLPEPAENRPDDTPWPMWPRILRTSSSHSEGCERLWSVSTKKLTGLGTKVRQLHACKVEWIKNGERWKMKEVPDTNFVLDVDLVILAMGFEHVSHEGLVKDMGLHLDARGNLSADDSRTSETGIFAAGDAISGPSLVVHAINSGRQAASGIDQWLGDPPIRIT